MSHLTILLHKSTLRARSQLKAFKMKFWRVLRMIPHKILHFSSFASFKVIACVLFFGVNIKVLSFPFKNGKVCAPSQLLVVIHTKDWKLSNVGLTRNPVGKAVVYLQQLSPDFHQKTSFESSRLIFSILPFSFPLMPCWYNFLFDASSGSYQCQLGRPAKGSLSLH